MKKKENVKNLIIALIFGIIAFVILLVVNSSITQNEVDMVWSVKDIPQGTILTEDNIDEYVQAKPTNDAVKNDEIVVNKKELIGMIAARDIAVSELMQKGFFLKSDDVKNNFKNPVLVSFSATDYTSTVNGVIRRGDHINISKLKDKNTITATETETPTTSTVSTSTDSSEETSDQVLTDKEENFIMEDAYIVDAFDSSGIKIDPSDKTSIATSFNIYIEKEDEASFYNAVNDRNIAVSKIEGQNQKNK